jgi:hypothetical protein
MSGYLSPPTVRLWAHRLRDLALPLLAGWGGVCFAQPPPHCASTDRACLEENYSRMCFDAGATPESCGAWLREFESSPDLDVRSSVAGIYLLADGYWRASNPQPWLKDRAAALIHGVLEQDPKNVEALLGLASIAPTRDESVAALRRVVALDPSPMHLEFLSGELAHNEANLAESAALLERAYETAMQRSSGNYAWRFARNAVFEYGWAGLPDRAAQLRKRFEQDVGLDAKVAEIAHAEAVEPARLNDVLGELCAELILRMLGAERCLAGIEHVVAGADAAGGKDKTRLANDASDAMFLAARTGDVLSAADPSWRSRFESTLRRYSGPEAARRMHEQMTEITVE